MLIFLIEKMQKKSAENLRYAWPICIRDSKSSFKKAAFDSFIGACRYRKVVVTGPVLAHEKCQYN